MHLGWQSLRDLGDSAFIVTVVFGMSASLWVNEGRRVAVRWIVVLSGASAIVVATKIAFFGWGIGIRALDFTGISGHTMLSAAVYPVFGWLVASKYGKPAQWRCVTAGALLALGVAVASVAVGVHSASEVTAGLALGGIASALTIAQPSPRLRDQRINILITVAACCAAVITYGHRAETGEFLMMVATKMSGASQPYTRDSWTGT